MFYFKLPAGTTIVFPILPGGPFVCVADTIVVSLLRPDPHGIPAKAVQMVEFIGNLPPTTSDAVIEKLAAGCSIKMFAPLSTMIRRAGRNMVGPALGEKAHKGDIGVYHYPEPLEPPQRSE